jgi:hypothetical protein
MTTPARFAARRPTVVTVAFMATPAAQGQFFFSRVFSALLVH